MFLVNISFLLLIAEGILRVMVSFPIRLCSWLGELAIGNE
jgi:hypothetical protein